VPASRAERPKGKCKSVIHRAPTAMNNRTIARIEITNTRTEPPVEIFSGPPETFYDSVGFPDVGLDNRLEGELLEWCEDNGWDLRLVYANGHVNEFPY
jgi:hypothetical protein